MEGDAAEARLVRFGIFEADLAAGELRRKGARIKLQEQPFQALAVLLERPGDVVTREELRQRLWPEETFGDFEHGLNRAVRKLREALDDSAETPRFVETLPKRGYRFIAPVETGSRAAADTGRPRRFGRKHAAILGVAAAAVLLLSLNAGRLRPGGAPAEIRALAVMPFDNLSRDADQEYFADGVTDALITELGKVGALRVISRQSVMRYKKVDKPLPEIAAELKVDAVVEGTVLRAGNRVRITTQLMRARPEQHLWAVSYERPYADILALQAEIARNVVRQVQAKLTPEEENRLAGRRPHNPEALEAYLRGKYFSTATRRRGSTRPSKASRPPLRRIPISRSRGQDWVSRTGRSRTGGMSGPARLSRRQRRPRGGRSNWMTRWLTDTISQAAWPGS